MLGFHFPINFDQPYRALGITDFWRRWHITLSSWLRDYLYVPLGGNRKGPVRTYVNLSATMLLGGLWHGASWTFVVWGAYQGAWLVIERLLGKLSLFGPLPRPFHVLGTFGIACFGWVFFRSTSLESAFLHCGAMLGISPAHGVRGLGMTNLGATALLAGVILTWAFPTTQALAARSRLPWVLALQVFFALAVLHLHYENHVPFLYYQF
jgi:alginate O-acetyltransferase complex protein AlgI